MRWRTAGGPVCRPYGEQQALSRSGGRGNSLFPLSRCARHLPLIRGVVLPYDSQEYLLGLGRGGPWASRQDTHRERWLRKPRRMSGTAAAAIFANPGPSGPAGIQTSHSDFARRKFFTRLQKSVPRNGVRGKRSYGHEVSNGRVPGGVLSNPSLLPAKPSEAGLPGRGGARERTQFSREEEEQGNERSFRCQAETEWSGLCDDELPWAK